VRRGGTLVSVDTGDADRVDRAADLPRQCGAIDLDNRSERRRSECWAPGVTGGATTAGATPRAGADAVRAAADADDSTRRLPVIEQELALGTRIMQRGGVRVFTRIVDTPVEEQVQLREEHAQVERRPVDRPATEADFAAMKEDSMEIRETREEAVVAKRAHVTEEVEVGKRATERTETVRDSVRHTEVDVDRISADERDHATARQLPPEATPPRDTPSSGRRKR
jgi:uncharacterized protein (TIGR02271 family)